jgi:hypothetical protein
MPSVMISSPAEGGTVDGPSVTVDLMAHGFTVVPAGDSTPNSGHLHLFLDRDLSAPDQPIPTEPGYIVHMGNGASTYTFENVAPGERAPPDRRGRRRFARAGPALDRRHGAFHGPLTTDLDSSKRRSGGPW